MAGERNANGYIPFSKFRFWCKDHNISKYISDYYWDIIKISEGIVRAWNYERTR